MRCSNYFLYDIFQTQSYELTVPDDLVCPNCILRLVRQASEWGEYKFKSCADVNIVPYDVSKKPKNIENNTFDELNEII